MGKQAKPTELHLVEGTYNPTRHGGRPKLSAPNSKPVTPVKLSPEIKEVWDFYIDKLPWNTETESDSFLMFCDLAADYRKKVKGLQHSYDWTPSLMGQYSKLRSELGIGYAEQLKLTVPLKPHGKGKNKEEEHFD